MSVVLGLAGGIAHAEPQRYVGSHPIPEGIKGSYCYIEIAHNHGYTPESSEFVMTDRGRDFVGDPSEHGYEGPLFGYSGPHVALREGGETCYREGEHFHDQLPQHQEKFIEKDGVLHGQEVAAERLAQAEETPAEPEIQKPAVQKRVTRRRSTRSARPSSSASRSKTTPRSSPGPEPAPIARVPVPKPQPEPQPAPDKAKKSAYKSWMERRLGR